MKISVLAKTNVKKNEIRANADGSLTVAITAIPEKGKANQAIEKAIAKYFHVAKNSVQIIAGHTSRKKIIEILGK